MNIVGCDDLGALFLTIVTCVTVGATSVRPQRDRSLRKERPRIRLTIAWEANGLPYGIDVAYEFTYGAPRSYPRAPSLAALPQFTLSHPTENRFIIFLEMKKWRMADRYINSPFSIFNSQLLKHSACADLGEQLDQD